MGWKVCMLAVVGITAALVIRQWRSDLLPLLRIAVILTLGTLLIGAATPILTLLSSLGELSCSTVYTSVLIKGLGIALLTQLCAQICRECGEGGIADSVELAGKVELLLLCLPLIEEILALAKELLSIGGGG